MFRPRWGDDGDPGGGSPGQGDAGGRVRTYAGAAAQGAETQQEKNIRFGIAKKEFQSRLEMEDNKLSLAEHKPFKLSWIKFCQV